MLKAARHHLCLQAQVPQTVAAEAAAAEAAATKQATEARQLESGADAPLDPYYQQVRRGCSPIAASACRARKCNQPLTTSLMRGSHAPAPAAAGSESAAVPGRDRCLQQDALSAAEAGPAAQPPPHCCHSQGNLHSACTLQLPCSQSLPQRGHCGLCTEGACALSSLPGSVKLHPVHAHPASGCSARRASAAAFAFCR